MSAKELDPKIQTLLEADNAENNLLAYLLMKTVYDMRSEEALSEIFNLPLRCLPDVDLICVDIGECKIMFSFESALHMEQRGHKILVCNLLFKRVLVLTESIHPSIDLPFSFDALFDHLDELHLYCKEKLFPLLNTLL